MEDEGVLRSLRGLVLGEGGEEEGGAEDSGIRGGFGAKFDESPPVAGRRAGALHGGAGTPLHVPGVGMDPDDGKGMGEHAGVTSGVGGSGGLDDEDAAFLARLRGGIAATTGAAALGGGQGGGRRGGKEPPGVEPPGAALKFS